MLEILCLLGVFEIFISSVNYTFDVYTALSHIVNEGKPNEESRSGVGITSGLAAVDFDAEAKMDREYHFPLELVEQGLNFLCAAGNASKQSDKVLILATIGNETKQKYLDQVIHGRFAAAALGRGIALGGDR